jgi:GNAT superfamily N-acetyltransferase
MDNKSPAESDIQYRIRRMNTAEVNLAIDWAANEGWNPGLNDGKCFYGTDPNGFFIGELSGMPVGCISAVAYDDNFGFIGLYIVKPECRGKGYGIRLWNTAIEYLGDRNIGLDGVLAQQGNYERSGFRLAYKNVRYEGFVKGKRSAHVVGLDQIPFQDLLLYDSQIFPAPRQQFLKRWVTQPGSAAYGFLDGTKLHGYGVIRPCRIGYKIGPLFADREEAAESLLVDLANKADGAPVYLDVPEVNTAAVSIAERHDMHVVFETVRMYTKKPCLSQIHRVFGVTTFELG